ncbi:TPA: type II toxin-antitoxin system RelE/ParE family toxin [Mannheimia haemolytica]|nr:type II toxin-antitoxin system RelE/ParE family toxin [Mannheimia haemolytica]HDL1238829.1 type II toxin-antitoxin system RelE/ParE family toxin [Mannheimia haemolytica]
MKIVVFQRKALKQLRKIPTGAEIHRKCDDLAYFPYCANIKALTNHQYDYRFRVGNYRIFFNIEGETMNIVSIEEVKKRDERTY